MFVDVIAMARSSESLIADRIGLSGSTARVLRGRQNQPCFTPQDNAHAITTYSEAHLMPARSKKKKKKKTAARKASGKRRTGGGRKMSKKKTTRKTTKKARRSPAKKASSRPAMSSSRPAPPRSAQPSYGGYSLGTPASTAPMGGMGARNVQSSRDMEGDLGGDIGGWGAADESSEPGPRMPAPLPSRSSLPGSSAPGSVMTTPSLGSSSLSGGLPASTPAQGRSTLGGVKQSQSRNERRRAKNEPAAFVRQSNARSQAPALRAQAHLPAAARRSQSGRAPKG